MKKKGFTLIELLAIIVILAVISVITIPIILKVVEESRRGAAIDSAFGYRDAVLKTYVSGMSKNADFTMANNVYSVNGTNGRLEYGLDNEDQDDDVTYDILLDGNIPNDGIVEIYNNNVTKLCVTFGNYSVSIIGNKYKEAGKSACIDSISNFKVVDEDDEPVEGAAFLIIDPTLIGAETPESTRELGLKAYLCAVSDSNGYLTEPCSSDILNQAIPSSSLYPQSFADLKRYPMSTAKSGGYKFGVDLSFFSLSMNLQIVELYTSAVSNDLVDSFNTSISAPAAYGLSITDEEIKTFSDNITYTKNGNEIEFVFKNELSNDEPDEPIDNAASTLIDSIPDGEISDDGLVEITHTDDPETTDYRYAGSSPKNYIYFNCSDKNNQTKSTCETWRIIGIFDSDNDGKIDNLKIIRDAYMQLKEWNIIDPGISEWDKASLKYYLNGTTSGNYYYGLSNYSKSLIQESIWYLGGFENPSIVNAEFAYLAERSAKTYYTENCVGNPDAQDDYGCNNGSWANTTISANVGLMYPSDYGFASSECYNVSSKRLGLYDDGGCNSTDWIYKGEEQDFEWTITHSTGNGESIYVYYLCHDISYGDSSDVYYYQLSYRPTVYLIPGIELEGTGTSTDPYRIIEQ